MNSVGRSALLALSLGAGLFLASCGPKGALVIENLNSTNDDVVEVLLTADDTFSPANVTISPGTTVRWTNVTDNLHTITPDGHTEWVPAVLTQAGQTFEHTFLTPGSYPYYSQPDADLGMAGNVTVE